MSEKSVKPSSTLDSSAQTFFVSSAKVPIKRPKKRLFFRQFVIPSIIFLNAQTLFCFTRKKAEVKSARRDEPETWWCIVRASANLKNIVSEAKRSGGTGSDEPDPVARSYSRGMLRVPLFRDVKARYAQIVLCSFLGSIKLFSLFCIKSIDSFRAFAK